MVRIWLFYKLSYEKLFIVCTIMPVNSVIKIERLTLCGPLSRAVNPPPHQILKHEVICAQKHAKKMLLEL